MLNAEVEDDPIKCAEHCHETFSTLLDKTLASSAVDLGFGDCCCYTDTDCSCKGTVGVLPVPSNVVMFPGFSFPEEVCPMSRVDAG